MVPLTGSCTRGRRRHSISWSAPGCSTSWRWSLRRDKFRSRLPRAYGEEFLSLVADLATLVPDPRDVPAVTPDPKDDYLPALARASAVDHLVSGDRRHLPPDSTVVPPIITPGELVGILDLHGAFEPPGLSTRRSARLGAWRTRRSRWQA
ncbi:MAG: hypothetical protein J2P39_15395, partial [Candidatus Dormibacteraeota bacterium]|nr:hypothetical protein [Candidatus Dormibacteraeota bacterium]